MVEIKINLSDAELKALAYVAVDPQEWIQNAASARSASAMEELFQDELKRMLQDPTVKNIPADREAVVLASNLPSAAERQLIETPEAPAEA